jgi:hypothetical protein
MPHIFLVNIYITRSLQHHTMHMDLSFFLEQSIVCGVMIHGSIPNFLQAFAELRFVMSHILKRPNIQ